MRRPRRRAKAAARAAADPRRRTPDRRDLAAHRARTATTAPRHAHRPDRHAAADDPSHRHAARDPDRRRHHRTAADHRATALLKRPSAARRHPLPGQPRAWAHTHKLHKVHKRQQPRAISTHPCDHQLRNSGVTVAIVAIAALLLAAVTPTMIPFVFGEEFRDAVPMVLILLAASIPAAAGTVLSSALVAANRARATMRAELAALAVTIPA